MNKYLRQQKITRRKKPSRLVIAVITGGLLINAAGIAYYLNAPKYESISQKRERYLKLANEQLMQEQDPATIIGLNKVITDIKNGVYDY